MLAQGGYSSLLGAQPWRWISQGHLPRRARRYTRALYMLGILGNAAVVTLYLITRTVGIPFFGPGAGEVDKVTALGLISKAIELALSAVLVVLVFQTRVTPCEQGSSFNRSEDEIKSERLFSGESGYGLMSCSACAVAPRAWVCSYSSWERASRCSITSSCFCSDRRLTSKAISSPTGCTPLRLSAVGIVVERTAIPILPESETLRGILGLAPRATGVGCPLTLGRTKSSRRCDSGADNRRYWLHSNWTYYAARRRLAAHRARTSNGLSHIPTERDYESFQE